MRTWSWPDEAACQAQAAQLAARWRGLPGGADGVITLEGPLGAGKTTFVRHLLRALGIRGRVRSPTYTVVEPYAVDGLDIWHFDFYRFDDPREFVDAGFRDTFAQPGLKLVEWPERAQHLMPPPDLRLSIEPLDGEARVVHAHAMGGRGAALLG